MDISFFLKNDFQFVEEYQFNERYHSYVFSYQNHCIIIDDHFDVPEKDRFFFDYSSYCEMQINTCECLTFC